MRGDVQKSVQELISASPDCDAIFFATEMLAVNGLKRINALQIKVPDNLAVVSFDEAEAFELFYCPITHARQPLEKMGKVAVNTLMDIINHKKICKRIYLESNFHIGKSCGEK